MTFAELRRAESLAPRLPAFRLVIDAVRYGSVSVAGLTCDYTVLMLSMAAGAHYLVASLLGFVAGSLLTYWLCIRFVFAQRRGVSREAEALGFFVVGIGGLVLTQVLLYALVSGAGLAVGLAKVPTTGIVFFFNFFCRRTFVFSSGSAP